MKNSIFLPRIKNGTKCYSLILFLWNYKTNTRTHLPTAHQLPFFLCLTCVTVFPRHAWVIQKRKGFSTCTNWTPKHLKQKCWSQQSINWDTFHRKWKNHDLTDMSCKCMIVKWSYLLCTKFLWSAWKNGCYKSRLTTSGNLTGAHVSKGKPVLKNPFKWW